MIALMMTSLVLADFELGEFQMTGSSTDVAYLGLHGAPASADESKALTQTLSASVRKAGWRLRPVTRSQPAVDDVTQQQALELELVLGLTDQAARRAEGILRLHLGRPSTLLRSHQRSCRLLYAAAAAFDQNAALKTRDLMLGGLAGCAEKDLIGLAWSSARLVKAWRAVQRQGEADITMTAGVPGAQVYVDGLLLGALPVTLRAVPAGRHQIQLLSGGAGHAFEIELKAGDQNTVQIVEPQPGLAGLADGLVEPADVVALHKNLPRGVRRGLIVLRNRRGAYTALVLGKRGVATLQAESSEALGAGMKRLLKRLKPVPKDGLRLPGVSPSEGVPERAFEPLRAAAANDELPAPSAQLVEGMVEYGTKVTGKSPDALRALIQASQSGGAWRAQTGLGMVLGDLEWSESSQGALGGGVTGLWLGPIAPVRHLWYAVGARLHAGGAGAEPDGEGWDPMTYPVDPITAAEPSLEERIRVEGHGMVGAEAILGAGFSLGPHGHVLLLGEAGWRQTTSDLIHEQYVQGDASSTQQLRSTGEFNWAGLRLGGRLMYVHQIKSWQVGGSMAWSQTNFPPAELDLIIPASSQSLRAGLLFGRRF
jgi:hypothetical protein